jgi:hypothetical protein
MNVACETTTMGDIAMSNVYQDFDDEELESEQEGGDLVSQLRRATKKKDKQLKELMEELSSIKTAQRTNSIKSVLAEKKLNPKIANFIPADLDSSPEAIDNWIAENAEVFGLQVQKQEVSPDVATLRQIDAVAASANVPIGGDDLLLRLDQATSAAEIEQMIFGSQS